MQTTLNSLPNNLAELRTGTANDGRALFAIGSDPRQHPSKLRDLRSRAPRGWTFEVWLVTSVDAVLTCVGPEVG